MEKLCHKKLKDQSFEKSILKFEINKNRTMSDVSITTLCTMLNEKYIVQKNVSKHKRNQ